jgi:ATP-dependent DNA helicase RecQ
MDDQVKTILKTVFGYDEFRPLQEESIQNVLQKKDTLVIMPTGGGKSLCYQIPALIFEGLTVVVSPLISLMKDQVEQLVELGVSAILLNSSLSPREYSQNIRRIQNRQAKLLYVAPETLLKPDILSLLSSVPVDCITIDEAHCISEWGHDFRPEYRQIVLVRDRFPSTVCIALTATATPRVREDICKSLHFGEHKKFIASFNRENLFLQVAPKTGPLQQTLEFLQKFRDVSGIIYCFSRKQVESLAASLQEYGFSALPYHAGMADEERKKNQELFIRDDVQIIVATIAFGMGINKSNVRFVIHYDLPKSIESYYQEIGRAGRDGLRADCLLLLGIGDTQKIRYFIDQKEDPLQRQVALYHLDKLVDFAETTVCRRKPLIRYFGEEYDSPNCDMCDNCTSDQKEAVDITIPAQKFFSCIYRTGQLFGSAHIIDVLRGSQSKKILRHGHQSLSTHGIGKEFSAKQWGHLARQLIRQGYLTKDPAYGSLKLTPKANQVLGSKEKVFGALQEEPLVYDRGKDIVETYDKSLFELLRKRRKELADGANVPPYVVFSDKSLAEMATYFPQSVASMMDIHGVGEAKFAKYGAHFLEIIRRYCMENKISERRKQKTLPPKRKQQEPDFKPRHVLFGEAFNEGRSMEELTTEYDIKPSTALEYLYKFYQEGKKLRAEGLLTLSLLPPDQRQRIFGVFDKLGTQRLRPVFDALNGDIGYEELKLMRLCYLNP